jgi:hypothetical protein
VRDEFARAPDTGPHVLAAGPPITAHAHAGQAIADAVEAGVDSIEDCSFLTEDGVEARPEVIEAIARKGVVASLTLGVLPGSAPPPRIAGRMAALVDLFTGSGRPGSPSCAARTPVSGRRSRMTSCRTRSAC